jgi:hypothetical protein
MIRQQGHFVSGTGTCVQLPPTDISTAQDAHSPSLKGMFSKGAFFKDRGGFDVLSLRIDTNEYQPHGKAGSG